MELHEVPQDDPPTREWQLPRPDWRLRDLRKESQDPTAPVPSATQATTQATAQPRWLVRFTRMTTLRFLPLPRGFSRKVPIMEAIKVKYDISAYCTSVV